MIIECHHFNKFHFSFQSFHDNVWQLYSKIKLLEFYTSKILQYCFRLHVLLFGIFLDYLNS